MPATVIVTLRMSGHARASGYDRLQEFLDGSLIRPPEQWSLSQRALARGLRVMTQRSGSLWYQRANLISELSAARQWLGEGAAVPFSLRREFLSIPWAAEDAGPRQCNRMHLSHSPGQICAGGEGQETH